MLSKTVETDHITCEFCLYWLLLCNVDLVCNDYFGIFCSGVMTFKDIVMTEMAYCIYATIHSMFVHVDLTFLMLNCRKMENTNLIGQIPATLFNQSDLQTVYGFSCHLVLSFASLSDLAICLKDKCEMHQ